MQLTSLGLAILGLMASAIVAHLTLRRLSLWRHGQIVAWVNSYLCERYGKLPGRLRIIPTDDRLWPVIASFEVPGTGIRRNLQFDCGGPASTWALQSERDESK